ncbi:MAG TPA: cytochrome c oxidase assembly protein [Actinomycetaceae bacterium]|nr:cytochrome c oxidase assembly protein [Actinomycetaceae bacterium]
MTRSTPVWLFLGLSVALGPAAFASASAGAAAYEDIHVGFPGTTTAVVGALLRAATDLAGITTMGALVTVLFLHGRAPRHANRLRFAPDLTVLTWAAGIWAVLAALEVLVDGADANGMELTRLAEPGTIGSLYLFGYMPRAWTVTFIGAFIVWLCSHFGTTWTTLLPGLWSGTIAVLAPVAVGQLLVGPDHDIGSDAGTIQTLTIAFLLGPVLVDAVIRVAKGAHRVRSTVRRRHLQVAAGSGVLIGLVSEGAILWFKLAGTDPLDSFTGILGLVRIALLLALGLVMTLHTGARTTRSQAATRGLLVAAWVGLGAAMTRIPPPQYFVDTSISQVFMGFDVPEPPTLATLLGPGRLNLLFLVVAVAAVLGYLAMIRQLRRRGVHWPVARTVLWIAGWLTVVIATNSGIGRYSAPDLGVHMVVHMSLSMLAPILLVQGGFITLVLRAAPANRRRAGMHTWVSLTLRWSLLRRLYHPGLVFVVFVGSYYLLYFTPLFGEMMRYHWAHQLMNVHFLLIGYAYYSLIIGIDRPPRPLPHIGRLGYILAAMPFHAFLGVAIMSRQTLIGETFYSYLDLPWADLERSQQVAGAVAWAGGEIPLLVAVVALSIQWARQDDKEARRRDRHFDRGLDHEFDAYNEMLLRLSERTDKENIR